ncbi:hypothetical protein [Sphingobium sp. BS19]|uniref:hypothetical protein n=1 Tax=Sphingobium sp. BS19 TaxID=3018973 RepID=UPI0022ED95A3|nr:hypothetical protein [Sphingobium sp. BS19]GLJ00469.1 hypothetical protein Sbs19_42870 [Sphingobium sp. BS19]
MNVFVKTDVATAEARVDWRKLKDYVAICPWLPNIPEGTRTRQFSVALDFPLFCIFGDLIVDYTIRHASSIVGKIKQVMEATPSADQISIVSLANGSTFTQPTADLDLASGYVGGQFVRSVMTFDVRNYRDRAERAVADLPVVIGGDDA